MVETLIFNIADYGNLRKEISMGLMKGIYTALRFDKALASYSPEDRAAIRALVADQRDVKKLARQVFQQLPPDDSGPYALLLLYAEGAVPVTPGYSYLVVDRTTGRKYFVYYDGMCVVHNGKTISFSDFNREPYRWFRLPEIKEEDLSELA